MSLYVSLEGEETSATPADLRAWVASGQIRVDTPAKQGIDGDWKTVADFLRAPGREELRHNIEQHSERMANFVVSTGDVGRPYQVIGPVVYALNNRGIFRDKFRSMAQSYAGKISQARRTGQLDNAAVDLADIGFSLFTGDLNFEAKLYDMALFIGFEEMKQRAARLGADGVAWVRHDMDIDPTDWECFYLQVTGTAVRFTE